MTLPFTHAGREWTLRKHDTPLAEHRAGRITAEALAATPWYLTLYHGGKRITRSLGTARDADAIREAKLRLRTQAADPKTFEAALESTRRREAVTLDHLADRWLADGLPHDDGRRRGEVAAGNLRPFLLSALRWWGSKTISGIRPGTMTEFAAWRRGNTRAGSTGERSADLELSALSALCQWAVARELADRNPFASRPRFRRAEDISHAPEYMPATDDELHRLGAWLMAPEQPAARIVAGAHLMLCALTGLRPGEPAGLLLTTGPAGTRTPGTRYTVTLAGRSIEKLAVIRTKKGLNPTVEIHPALGDFLACWRRWLAEHLPTATHWFPDPDAPTSALVPFGDSNLSRLRNDLNAATSSLGLPRRHPHGMRAYYVRCRRAQGIDDAQIAVELGQGSGAALISRVYGDPQDCLGDAAFDWLPDAPAVPCWQNLSTTPTTNIIPIPTDAPQNNLSALR